MISFSSKYRSSQDEILDDLNLQGNELGVMLSDLKRVNALLGGNKITSNGISFLMKYRDPTELIHIIDLGCGDGAHLREVAKYGKKNHLNFKLIGVDANPHIIAEAKKRSSGFPEITYHIVDVFKLEESHITFDIAICTLFLHHFKSTEIEVLLQSISKRAKVGVVINDLHRSWIAFYSFKLFSYLFLRSSIAKHDGLVSVARGFKKKEWQQIISKAPNVISRIRWKWAFRWQVILDTSKKEVQNS